MHAIGRIATFGMIACTVTLASTGCATKGFVQESLGRQEAQVDQRFGTLEGKINEGTQRVGTLEGKVNEGAQRVGTLEGTVTEQNQRLQGTETQVKSLQSSVSEARDAAETARTKADEANTRLTNLWASRNTRTPVETFDVLFRFNRSDLSDSGQTTLRQVAMELKDNDKLVIELTGYADPSGQPEYNIQLTQRRVESVRRFLVDQGVALWRIQAIGMGAVAGQDMPKEKMRRVTVSIASLP